jgi:flagellar motor switch protein FliN/FliY
MNTTIDPTLPQRANASLAEPSPAAGPVAHTLALSELQDLSHPTNKPALVDLASPLHQIKTRLQVCVGEVVVTVGELLAAKEHQVFVLDRAVEQPVDILLEGKVIARGQLMAVEDQFAVRITELPIPLKP